MNVAVILAILVACVLGGLVFVFASGDDKATKRRQSISKPGRRNPDAAVDRATKKKQIADTVAELEKKSRNRRVDMQTRIEQAGLTIRKGPFIGIFAGAGVVLGGIAYIKTGNAIICAMLALAITVGLPNLVLARLRNGRIKKFINYLPDALDIIVRGVRAGLPVNDTLRIIANEAKEPVRSEFRRVVEQQSLGISVPDALAKMALRVPATETNFFAIVIEIQSKAGGNLSEAVGNLSKTVRDRKKMKGKISAMSMEAIASAAIIGVVPFVVTGALYFTSPAYISLLFNTSHGRMVMLLGLAWMSIGGFVMKKMISFDF